MSGTHKSMFLSPADCAEIFEKHRPRLEAALAEYNRDGLVVAVADPGLKPWEAVDLRGHGATAWAHNLLFTGEVGKPGKVPKDLAPRKAYDAFMRRCSYYEAANNHPATFVEGEVGWRGGLFKGGIAASMSGFSPDILDDELLEPFLDELVARSKENFACWNANKRQLNAATNGIMRRI